MKRRHKTYLKVNLVSLFFIVVSFISVTLAWFAYSGNARMGAEVGIKAWFIELEKNGNPVSSDLVISLSEIYPGMETMTEIVKIKNMGDSNAQLGYSIISARILGEPEDYYVIDEIEGNSKEVEDRLSHEYPFHININLTKSYIEAKTGESYFEVSISWPLDSGDDIKDSEWGNKAHYFFNNENEEHNNNPDYHIRPSIQVKININAKQYLEEDDNNDPDFPVQKQILYDVIANQKCQTLSESCLKTSVIDVNNKISDTKVNLIAVLNEDTKTIFDNYNADLNLITSSWSVPVKPLLAEEILSVIAKDIDNSFIIRPNISNAIIGNLEYENRLNTELNKLINANGYYQYLNDKFPVLYFASCVWTNTNYNNEYGFAINEINYEKSKLYNLAKANQCSILPIIEVNKNKLK